MTTIHYNSYSSYHSQMASRLPRVAAWLASPAADLAWIEKWLTKNKRAPVTHGRAPSKTAAHVATQEWKVPREAGGPNSGSRGKGKKPGKDTSELLRILKQLRTPRK